MLYRLIHQCRCIFGPCHIGVQNDGGTGGLADKALVVCIQLDTYANYSSYDEDPIRGANEVYYFTHSGSGKSLLYGASTNPITVSPNEMAPARRCLTISAVVLRLLEPRLVGLLYPELEAAVRRCGWRLTT